MLIRISNDNPKFCVIGDINISKTERTFLAAELSCTLNELPYKEEQFFTENDESIANPIYSELLIEFDPKNEEFSERNLELIIYKSDEEIYRVNYFLENIAKTFNDENSMFAELKSVSSIYRAFLKILNKIT